MEIPPELRQALHDRHVVPFVGAGVSRNVKRRDGGDAFPGWGKLLDLAAEQSDPDTRQLVQVLVKKGRYLDAAREAREALGANWLPFLRKQFDVPYSDINADSLSLACLVWKLGSDLVLTTNYEDVLRWAVDRPFEFTSISNRETDFFENVQKWRIAAPTVWHVHGRIANVDELILTPDGYERLYPEARAEADFRAAQHTLRHVFLARTVLFIGFGMEESIRNQLRWVTEEFKGAGGPHFVLVEAGKADEVRALLKDLRVQVVPFTGYDSLPVLLAELSALVGAVAAPPRIVNDPALYFEWLEKECGWIELKALRISSGNAGRYAISDLYIEPQARGAGESGPLSKAVAEFRSCVVEGDAGSGKSTFLKKFAWDNLQSAIFIRVAELDRFLHDCPLAKDGAPATANDGRWLPYFLSRREWGLAESYFAEQLGRKETALLLDGLDEAADDNRRERMARIVESARRLYPRCRMIVTTRPSAYEGMAIIGGFQRVTITDLDPGQIEAFIRMWSLLLHEGKEATAREHQVGLSRALDRADIRKLARNPLMLTALAVVHWNDKVLPEQRAALYESILTWMAKARLDRPERLPWERCLGLMGTLALAMQSYPGGHRVSLGRGDAAGILSVEFGGTAKAYRFLLDEEIDSGIITSNDNDIRYWHRTFQEYLAAWRLSGLTDDELWESTERYLWVREWREVLLLLAGSLCEAKGHGRLSLFLGKVLAKPQSLPDQARCVALVTAMMNDLRAAKYEMPDEVAERFSSMKTKVQAIFTVEGAAGLAVKLRAEAADALGVEGHPRLYLPNDERYWVRPEGANFRMGRYPVTVHEYVRFQAAHPEREEPAAWEEQLLTPSCPVVKVNRHDASAYCQWIGARLPTEQEWELAARGTAEREYPWGKQKPDQWRANFNMDVGAPTPVGMFAAGDTPDGIADLAGNVWEWTASDLDENRAVVRGGSWYDLPEDVRAAVRDRLAPGNYNYVVGFRCLRDFP